MVFKLTTLLLCMISSSFGAQNAYALSADDCEKFNGETCQENDKFLSCLKTAYGDDFYNFYCKMSNGKPKISCFLCGADMTEKAASKIFLSELQSCLNSGLKRTITKFGLEIKNDNDLKRYTDNQTEFRCELQKKTEKQCYQESFTFSEVDAVCKV